MSVLVAAGIAVYESPQFRRWVDQSRRKLAVALYNLGDEIHPREALSQDISMTEEAGQDAIERRRKAREEIEQRRELMHSRRSTRSSSAATSFDALVDQEGRLRSEDGNLIEKPDGNNDESTVAHSTALDSSQVASLQKRGGFPQPEGLTNARLEAQREMMDAMERDRIHLDIPLPSETSSHHPSESLVDLTPTSEIPDMNQETLADSSTASSLHDQMTNTEYFSTASLPNSTRDSIVDQPEYYYVHPNQSEHSFTEISNPTNPFLDHDVSTASSAPGSLDHVHDEIASDGTLSEWGHPTDGVLTPASWSEVGSVISSDDEHHHQ